MQKSDPLMQSVKKLIANRIRLFQLEKKDRQRLMPVILKLRRRYAQQGRRSPIPGFPTYQEVLRTLGISPSTVRSWRRRDALLKRQNKTTP